MWYINESECFEIELEHSRLHFTITTFCQLLGVWIHSRWQWDFEYKRVGWYFYQKIRFGFGFIGIEYLNYTKRTYWKDPKRYFLDRDMRFWRIFFREEQKDS